nr:uncharacterized protein LOC116778232 [Danaus plexippus plexippus]
MSTVAVCTFSSLVSHSYITLCFNQSSYIDVKTPICAVSGAQFLTRKGFLDLRNTLDADVPFNLFRDEGRTFLQWSGEDEVRKRMSGRMMVVRLLCRDISAAASSPLDLRGVFTPCVAFRVQGTPPRHSNSEL